MTPERNDVDAVIRRALSDEEAEFYDRLGEQSLFDLATEVFRGRHRWLAVMTVIVMAVFMATSILCLVKFLQADEIRVMLLWGAGFFFGMHAIMALKLWHWMEMNRLALSRELKRLELQIAHLAGNGSERRDRP